MKKRKTSSSAKRSSRTRIQQTSVRKTLRHYRQRRKQLSLLLSPSYHLTPQPVKKLQAKTNVPSLGTLATGIVLGRQFLKRSPCKRARDVRRHNAMRSKARGIRKRSPQKRRTHKCSKQ